MVVFMHVESLMSALETAPDQNTQTVDRTIRFDIEYELILLFYPKTHLMQKFVNEYNS